MTSSITFGESNQIQVFMEVREEDVKTSVTTTVTKRGFFGKPETTETVTESIERGVKVSHLVKCDVTHSHDRMPDLKEISDAALSALQLSLVNDIDVIVLACDNPRATFGIVLRQSLCSSLADNKSITNREENILRRDLASHLLADRRLKEGVDEEIKRRQQPPPTDSPTKSTRRRKK